jgi:hypothetical protein
MFTTAVLGREAVANMTALARQQMHDNVTPFKARLRAGFPTFSETDARSIETPTLLVTGDNSAPVLHRLPTDWSAPCLAWSGSTFEMPRI